VLLVKFIDWYFIEGKNDSNLNNVVGACKIYNLYDICRKRVTPKRGGELGLLKLSLNWATNKSLEQNLCK
jgi:hypothetical protein